MTSARKKISLSMKPVDLLVEIAEGNPGALTAIRHLTESHDDGLLDVLHLDDMNMRGPQIWVAFKDVCKGKVDDFRAKIRARDPEMINKVNEEMLRDPSWKEIAVKHGGTAKHL